MIEHATVFHRLRAGADLRRNPLFGPGVLALAIALIVNLATARAADATNKIQPTITLTADRNPLDVDHRTAVVTGTVTATMPDGSTGPLTNQQVEVNPDVGAGQPRTLTTDGDGHFSLAITPDDRSTIVEAAIQETDQVAAARAPQLWLEVRQTAARVQSCEVTPTRVTKTTPITVTGTVTYDTGAGPVPLTGRNIVVRDDKNFQILGSAPLNAAGAFSATVPITADPGLHPLYVAPDIPSDDLYFFPVNCGNAEGNVPVVVAPGTPRFVNFNVAFNEPGRAGVFGAIESPLGPNGEVLFHNMKNLPIIIEWSRNGRTRWRHLGQLISMDNGIFGTRDRGLPESESDPFPARGGYFRARFKGNDFLYPTTSPVVHAR
ncbi:hypothetical protein [Actinomadura rugatobispora]|uniref:Carboxypeptidase regulatory-like domain-containing protein n=1 Tax=Actinomadura rugatobispora TaxID=1994 RepID=A0ABW1AGY8_9ACTN